MPSRNITKEQAPNSHYHIYVRGINKQNLYNTDADYKYFIKLFERYLSKYQIISTSGDIYPNFVGKIEILAFCLLSNHFHLLVYQINVPYLEKFMRSLMTSYSKYYNFKYKRTGSLFESRYKAVLINHDAYLQHITRYIHLNPKRWPQYKYSSLKYYRDGNAPFWLTTTPILELFNSSKDYMNFVSDYVEMRDTLSDLKHQLADQ